MQVDLVLNHLIDKYVKQFQITAHGLFLTSRMVNLSCGNAGMCFCAFPEQGNSTGKLQSFTGSVIY